MLLKPYFWVMWLNSNNASSVAKSYFFPGFSKDKAFEMVKNTKSIFGKNIYNTNVGGFNITDPNNSSFYSRVYSIRTYEGYIASNLASMSGTSASVYLDLDNNTLTHTAPTNYIGISDSSTSDIYQENVYKPGRILSSSGTITPFYKDGFRPESNAYEFICVGKGSTPNTINTYALEDMVLYQEADITCNINSHTGFTITITNKTNSNLTINELGHITSPWTRSATTNQTNINKGNALASFYNIINGIDTMDGNVIFNLMTGSAIMIPINPMLTARTVLTTPVVIPPGETRTINWNITLNSLMI